MTIDEFLKQTQGKRIINHFQKLNGVSYIIPLSKYDNTQFFGDVEYADGTKAINDVFQIQDGIGNGKLWSFWSPPAPNNVALPVGAANTPINAVTTAIGQLTEDFVNKYKLKKIKRSTWKKNYVVPQGLTLQDKEFFGELYGMDGRFIRADTFYIEDPERKGDWILVDEDTVYKAHGGPTVSTFGTNEERHKCYCPIREVWAYGCKCGGV